MLSDYEQAAFRQQGLHLHLLSGNNLAKWCRHSIRLNAIGIVPPNSLQSALDRALEPEVTALVFLDLDETLTATNFAPEEFFDMMLRGDAEVDDSHVQEYMQNRVPRKLRRRMRQFLSALNSMPHVRWFILTDNVYSMALCTLKLALNMEIAPGTIIDREMRTEVIAGNKFSLDKAQLIKSFVVSRAEHGLSPPKVVFADNWAHHRTNVAAAFNTNLLEVATGPSDEENETAFYLRSTPLLVCCDDLETGLTRNHVNAILRFLVSSQNDTQ